LFIGVKTKWTRAVEKLVRKQQALKEEQKQKALNEGQTKSSDQASTVEKPRSSRGTGV